MTTELSNINLKEEQEDVNFSVEESKEDYRYFENRDRRIEKQLIDMIVRNSGLDFGSER